MTPKEETLYKLTCQKCGHVEVRGFDHKLSDEELKVLDTKCEKCGGNSDVMLIDNYTYKLTCPKCGYIGVRNFDHKPSEEELKAMNTKCDSCGCDSNVKLIGQGPYKKGKKGTIQDYGYKYKCPHCGVVRILHYDPLIDPSELRLECDQCKTLLEMKDVVNTIEVYRW
jgi:ribosomal protein S27AE